MGSCRSTWINSLFVCVRRVVYILCITNNSLDIVDNLTEDLGSEIDGSGADGTYSPEGNESSDNNGKVILIHSFLKSKPNGANLTLKKVEKYHSVGLKQVMGLETFKIIKMFS